MLQSFSASNSVSVVGTHQEFGTAAGVVAWGRWIGDVSGTGPTTFSLSGATANQGFHYVVGIPTAVMPAAGSASYSLLGATKATASDGSTLPGTFSGTLGVIFGASTTISLSATLAFNGGTSNFNLNGSLVPPGGSPSFTGSVSAISTGTPIAGYPCSSGCTTAVNGAFFGANAAYAGYTYSVSAPGGQSIAGAAVFKQ
jgi:hypothetical protein